MSDVLTQISLPRFLLDRGVLAQLLCVDSSYGETVRDGRIVVHIDYRRGQPRSVEIIRVHGAVSLKVHVSAESAG